MDYLARESAPLSEDFWGRLDAAVVKAARNVLTGRRFLSLHGPLGPGADAVTIDDAEALSEADSGGFITTAGRKLAELPTIYEDFTLLARDLERAQRSGSPADLSRAAAAAEACAVREEKLIYFGSPEHGYDGLLTAPGIQKLKKKNWAEGENAFSDVAAAISLLAEHGIYGPYALVLSPDLFMQTQRLQPGTGLLEFDRVSKLVDGRVFRAPVLGKGRAALLAPDRRNMDLAVGQDMAAAYLEQKDLNHVFRVLESVLPRVKRAKAIVAFE